jgi:hypothetical protein
MMPRAVRGQARRWVAERHRHLLGSGRSGVSRRGPLERALPGQILHEGADRGARARPRRARAATASGPWATPAAVRRTVVTATSSASTRSTRSSTWSRGRIGTSSTAPSRATSSRPPSSSAATSDRPTEPLARCARGKGGSTILGYDPRPGVPFTRPPAARRCAASGRPRRRRSAQTRPPRARPGATR